MKSLNTLNSKIIYELFQVRLVDENLNSSIVLLNLCVEKKPNVQN
jgi:hypothetical protein